MSVILTLSRARAEYPCMPMNPIVPSMARIVMTTTSSVRVKPKREAIGECRFLLISRKLECFQVVLSGIQEVNLITFIKRFTLP